MATKLNTLVTADDANNNLVDSQQRIVHILTLIKRTLPYLPLFEDATKVMSIPNHAGGFGASGVVSWRKFNALAVSTTPLTEGTTPDGLNIDVTTVTDNLDQYGDWIKISDIAASASIDDVMKEAMDLLAENAGQKLHKVIMNALTGGDVDQIIYGGSATAANQLTNADVLTSTVIKKAVRYLRNANVQPYPDGFYRGIIHPYQAYDLQNDSLWQDISRYNGGSGVGGGLNLISGEIGKMHGVRFRESSEVLSDTAGAASAATYSAFVYGPHSFGVFDLKSQAVNNIDSETNRGISIHSIPINTPTKDDPLGLFGLVGWKASFAAKVYDPDRIVRLRTGSTQ